MPIQRLHIFDMDGTLVDSSHRYRTRIDENGLERIDLDFWRKNEDKCTQDSLLPLVDEYRKLLESSEDYVVIATARNFCRNCFIMVREILGWPNKLIYRELGDNSKGVDMKLKPLLPLLNLKQFSALNEVIVYEDNEGYLEGIAQAISPRVPVRKVFVPSNQGY